LGYDSGISGLLLRDSRASPVFPWQVEEEVGFNRIRTDPVLADNRPRYLFPPKAGL
jgi:hypothetical protein